MIVYGVCAIALTFAALSSDAQVALITGVFGLINTLVLLSHARHAKRLEQRQETITTKLDRVVPDDET